MDDAVASQYGSSRDRDDIFFTAVTAAIFSSNPGVLGLQWMDLLIASKQQKMRELKVELRPTSTLVAAQLVVCNPQYIRL